MDFPKEVYRYKRENAELQTKLEEEKTIEVNKPSGWQWFQIWLGRICAAVILTYIIYRKFNKQANS